MKKKNKSPEYTIEMPKGERKKWTNRILIFTPTTGIIRMEWVRARYGQIIPTNWSNVEMSPYISSYVPVEYQLADAQNLMAKHVVEGDYEWVMYIEHDNVLPPDAFVRMNEYMIDGTIPVISGLYFTKSNPPEPILYRGRGTAHFADWKLKDQVWVDGIPFGFRLEHASLIKEAWKESPEYKVGDEVTRRVFERAEAYWFDPEHGMIVSTTGTTDLAWCTRLMEKGLFEKAGWPEYQKMKYPFLVDTNIQVGHITNDGVIYPDYVGGVPKKFISNEQNYKGKEIR